LEGLGDADWLIMESPRVFEDTKEDNNNNGGGGRAEPQGGWKSIQPQCL